MWLFPDRLRASLKTFFGAAATARSYLGVGPSSGRLGSPLAWPVAWLCGLACSFCFRARWSVKRNPLWVYMLLFSVSRKTTTHRHTHTYPCRSHFGPTFYPSIFPFHVSSGMVWAMLWGTRPLDILGRTRHDGAKSECLVQCMRACASEQERPFFFTYSGSPRADQDGPGWRKAGRRKAQDSSRLGVV